MDVRHDDEELEQIELDARYCGRLDQARASAFREALNLLRMVKNECELRSWRGLNFEKLKGKRQHQHSIRLNKQYRIILEFESRPGPNNNVAVVKGIEDYH